ncbi:MAG: hypothetical protein Q8O74_00375, partial [bacterium]|nr:hypothetical protein [bacterium]
PAWPRYSFQPLGQRRGVSKTASQWFDTVYQQSIEMTVCTDIFAKVQLLTIISSLIFKALK